MTDRGYYGLGAATKRHRSTSGLHLVETLHRAGARTGRHVHGAARLCLIVAGGFEEAESTSSWSRPHGVLLFYPAGVEHENQFSVRGARCLNIELPTSLTPTVGVQTPKGVVDLGPRPAWIAARIYDRLRAGSEGRTLDPLIEGILKRLDRENGEARSFAPAWAARARVLIERKAADGITLSEAAEILELSRSVLARGFRERMGCSVGEYRHRVLVRRARHMLLATNASLSAIAFRLGFADQSHFTRVFKRHTSFPPGRYRRLSD